MHALILLCINQYTKLEVPSFTNYKDMIGAKNVTHVTVTTPLLRVVCHCRLVFDTGNLHAKFDDCRFRDIIGVSKFEVGHMHRRSQRGPGGSMPPNRVRAKI